MYADARLVRFLNHEIQACADFDRALGGARWHGRLAALAGRPNGLLRYDEALRDLAVAGASYRGVATVAVERIVGSVDRAGDFDFAFRPRRADGAARWQRVALAYHAGVELPLVSLYRVGEAYFVIDGHHRVSVARALGRGFVDAEVVEILVRPAVRSVATDTAGPSLRHRLGTALVGLGTRIQCAPAAGTATP
jgi:hypothetical protein